MKKITLRLAGVLLAGLFCVPMWAQTILTATVPALALGSYSAAQPNGSGLVVGKIDANGTFRVIVNGAGQYLMVVYPAANSGYSTYTVGIDTSAGGTINITSQLTNALPTGVGGMSVPTSTAVFRQMSPSAPVIAKGSTYDGMACNAVAAPGVHKPLAGDTSILATVSCWNNSASKWFSTFFTSPSTGSTAMKSWTQVAGSSIAAGGADYIAGNGDVIHYSDGNYYFVYTHYPSGSGCTSSETISIRQASTILGLASASDFDKATTGFGDLQFAQNPSGNLEMWAVQCSGGLANTYGYWTSSSPSTNTWSDFNPVMTYTLDPTGGGEPAVFYIGGDRFITFDSCCSTLGGRYTRLYSNPAQGAKWYGLGAANVPNPLYSWQASQVFDLAGDVFDTGDGLGNVPRFLFAGGDNVSNQDNTDSSIGYATGLQSYGSTLGADTCHPLFYLVSPTVGITDPNLCWDPVTQRLTSGVTAYQVLDNFAGASGTALTAHTTAEGQSWTGWTQHSGDCGSFASVTLSGSGSVSNSAACDASMNVSFTPTSADYKVCATGTATNANFNVSGRVSASADTRYVVVSNSAASNITLYNATAGSYSAIGNRVYSWSGSHQVCLAMTGSTPHLVVTLDSTPIIDVTDPGTPNLPITAAGTAGVSLGQNGTVVTQLSVQ